MWICMRQSYKFSLDGAERCIKVVVGGSPVVEMGSSGQLCTANKVRMAANGAFFGGAVAKLTPAGETSW